MTPKIKPPFHFFHSLNIPQNFYDGKILKVFFLKKKHESINQVLQVDWKSLERRKGRNNNEEEKPTLQEKPIKHFMRPFFDIITLSVLLSIYVVFKFIKVEMCGQG